MRRFAGLTLLLALCGVAHAQAALVRACPTQPTNGATSNWNACSTWSWQLAAAATIADTLPAGSPIDVWQPLGTAPPGASVAACPAGTVASGSSSACTGPTGAFVPAPGSATTWMPIAALSLNQGAYSITVTWTAPTAYTDGSSLTAPVTYDVYRASSPTATPVAIASGLTGTSLTDAGLSAGTYCYAVASVVAGVESDRTAITAGGAMCATVPVAKKPMPPSAVAARP